MNNVNRYIMREFGIKEYDITIFQKKANEFRSVTVFDKMVTSDRGYLVSTPHFNIDEMIAAQKIFVDEVRADWTDRNKALLKILEEAKIKLLIRELAGMKFNKIVTIHKSEDNQYLIEDRPLIKVLHDLQNGFIAIPF